MHFDMTISLGQIAVIVTLVGVAVGAVRRMDWYMVEHEILMQDYCERRRVKVKDLPTRQKLWGKA
jgi:hypothetical protein